VEKDLRTPCVCVLLAFEQLTDFIDTRSSILVVPNFNSGSVFTEISDFVVALVIGVSLSRPLVIHYFHTNYFSRLFFLSIIYEYSPLLIETILCFRSLMQGRYSIHAPLLVKTLLHHFVSQEKAPPGLYRSSGGGSVVIGLASMLI